MLYEIRDENLLVGIFRAAHRREAYVENPDPHCGIDGGGLELAFLHPLGAAFGRVKSSRGLGKLPPNWPVLEYLHKHGQRPIRPPDSWSSNFHTEFIYALRTPSASRTSRTFSCCSADGSQSRRHGRIRFCSDVPDGQRLPGDSGYCCVRSAAGILAGLNLQYIEPCVLQQSAHLLDRPVVGRSDRMVERLS